MPAVYCSSDQNSSPQVFLNPLRKVLPVLLTYVALIRVKFLSFGVSWERYLYGDLIVTSSWLLSPIPNLRLRQYDLHSVLWRSWRNFQILSTHRWCVPNVVRGPFAMACHGLCLHCWLCPIELCRCIFLLLCRPDVDFDVRLMRAVQVMDIPMLKDFINALVMDSLTYGKMKICAAVLIQIPIWPGKCPQWLRKLRRSQVN